jgi:hypothetical protein
VGIKEEGRRLSVVEEENSSINAKESSIPALFDSSLLSNKPNKLHHYFNHHNIEKVIRLEEVLPTSKNDESWNSFGIFTYSLLC